MDSLYLITLYRTWTAHGMDTPDKLVSLDAVPDSGIYPRHNSHTEHHIIGVCDLHPDLTDRASDRSHAEWYHVHRPACKCNVIKC